MLRIAIVVLLGTALFVAAAWQLDLLKSTSDVVEPPVTGKGETVTADKLGGDLYKAAEFVPFQIPKAAKEGAPDPIVLYGIMNTKDQEEVSSQVNGRILFLGAEVDSDIAPLAGSAALLAEPYYMAKVQAGREVFIKFYRRLYEGQVVHKDQMLAMIDPPKALGTVLEKLAKIEAAKADGAAAEATVKEAQVRYTLNIGLHAKGAIGAEDLRASELTWVKTKYERDAKLQAVQLAYIDKDLAEVELRLHEIRPFLPYENMTIKSIQKQQGYAVKPGDPILMVQNIDRLQAEAQIELAYFARFKNRARFTATIEPTILEAPVRELPGHAREVTSVAVARDMKIVSGSEDHTVCVWTQNSDAPLRKMEHNDAVQVVACTPAAAEKNLCLVGCLDGSIYLWDLDKDDAEPIQKIETGQAHGKDTSITSVAFSPDGTWFASGASDGSIRLWTTNDGKLLYPFTPEYGVAQCHEDAVTSLHFTPQCRLVSAGRDKTLCVWKLHEKGAEIDGKPVRDRSGKVNSLGVSRDGSWMLFDQERTIKLYSVKTRNFVHAFSTAASSTPFSTLAEFSPDGAMILTAGLPEGRLQLWRAPDEKTRAYEVRQFATKTRDPVTCAAFSPNAGKGGHNSFAVSGSGSKIYLWSIPNQEELSAHRILDVPLTLTSHNVDPSTGQIRIGFEVPNLHRRFEAGRTVTIVID